MVINNITSLLKKFFNNKYSKNSSFLLIINYLGLALPENVPLFTQYVFAVITLSLIALISFINVCIYFFIIYNLNYLENKYPIFKTNKFIIWWIKRYKNTSKWFIFLEVLLGIFSLLILFVGSILGFKNMI